MYEKEIKLKITHARALTQIITTLSGQSFSCVSSFLPFTLNHLLPDAISECHSANALPEYGILIDETTNGTRALTQAPRARVLTLFAVDAQMHVPESHWQKRSVSTQNNVPQLTRHPTTLKSQMRLLRSK